jgi:hypothetical protein
MGSLAFAGAFGAHTPMGGWRRVLSSVTAGAAGTSSISENPSIGVNPSAEGSISPA